MRFFPYASLATVAVLLSPKGSVCVAAAGRFSPFSFLARSGLISAVPLLLRRQRLGACASLGISSLASPLSAGAESSFAEEFSPPGEITNTLPLDKGTATMATTGTVTATAKPVQATQLTLLPEKSAEDVALAKPPVEKFRLDYRPTDFEVLNVDLDFLLDETATRVTSTLTMRRRLRTPPCDLVLDGEGLTLQGAWVDGEDVLQSKKALASLLDLRVLQEALPVEDGKTFKLKTQVMINPKENLALSGLYRSGALFVTQCEAEGFRRITYMLDRPDVLARYRVRMEADKAKNPVLLSNGNIVDSGLVDGEPAGRHFVVFEDPHPKPSYLFALVAGDLSDLSTTFKTMSGREVNVQLFAEKKDVPRLHWALESVLKSMKWDEEEFGREYDLDTFRVVCVSDFNMGAMENKGLNIFNTSLLLADSRTTTDLQFETIRAVVGHEYFHNWTGNRVTCRDWFQLTLKEGLTVFRDQLFSAAMGSEAVERISQVVQMYAHQFTEDAGPMAHPIRPESYIAMDNFYTATVYEKGAEVVRMYYTLLGKEGFRKGMDLYFERHDGQAVTCDDFRKAMADANFRNMDQFERWYLQAGTPEVEVLEAAFNSEEQTFTLRLRQHTPPTPKQPEKLPLVIPIAVGLIGRQSQTDLLSPATQVLEMTEAEQTFKLSGVSEPCVLSLLRGFSAPVRVKDWQSAEDLSFLMAFDSDPVNQWQASQTLAKQAILQRAKFFAENGTQAKPPKLCSLYTRAFKEALSRSASVDAALLARTLDLPGWSVLEHEMHPVDVDALHAAFDSTRRELGSLFHVEMRALYDKLTLPPGSEEVVEKQEIARRRLRNALLVFLTASRDAKAAELAFLHFLQAGCMTDRMAGMLSIADMDCAQREEALKQFYEEANGDALVLDKWFRIQAGADLPDTVEQVEELLRHPEFTFKRPDRVRAVLRVFAANPKHFHRPDGKGYRLMADAIIKIDGFNAVMAARLLSASLMDWQKYDTHRQALMLAEIERIKKSTPLSTDTFEIVQKAQAAAPSASS